MPIAANLWIMTSSIYHDPASANLWHPIAACAELRDGEVGRTTLLDEATAYRIGADGTASVWRSDAEGAKGGLPCRIQYGYIWTCLGDPPADLFEIVEYAEPDRRNMNAISIGVHSSAPRAIENFLDMGHFPFVHKGILGAEPHTEVKDYDVEISVERDEVLATRCRFFQPQSSAAANQGAEVDYIYRIPHPYCAVLYKTSAIDASRRDVIAIFAQPMEQERTRAHLLLSILDEHSDDSTLRRFQQTVFGQDKPILENQFPRRLPLDPRAELPIRADKASIAYRRWLARKGVTYGVIPVAA